MPASKSPSTRLRVKYALPHLGVFTKRHGRAPSLRWRKHAAGNLLQLKVRGMFEKADYDRIIQIAKEAIDGRVRSTPSSFLKDSKAGSDAETGET